MFLGHKRHARSSRHCLFARYKVWNEFIRFRRNRPRPVPSRSFFLALSSSRRLEVGWRVAKHVRGPPPPPLQPYSSVIYDVYI